MKRHRLTRSTLCIKPQIGSTSSEFYITSSFLTRRPFSQFAKDQVAGLNVPLFDFDHLVPSEKRRNDPFNVGLLCRIIGQFAITQSTNQSDSRNIGDLWQGVPVMLDELSSDFFRSSIQSPLQFTPGKARFLPTNFIESGQ